MLVLASTSPTRKALLAGAGIAFTVAKPRVNERDLEAAWAGERPAPATVALRLALAKAQAVPGTVVVGADQVLELEGRILHKAGTPALARDRLDQLRGREHRLHTAVTIVRDGVSVWHHLDTAVLVMRDFSPAARDAVIAAEGEAIQGSVGCYRLEGPAIHLFERIAGDYFAILGLPLLPLLAALRRHAPETLDGFT